jgi:exosortase D (VPLPA-CTERM-specific)
MFTWLVLGLATALILVTFREGLDHLAYMWFNKEEYSHAVIIPFISAFLIWQKKDLLRQTEFSGSWAGIVLLVVSILLLLLGKQSALIILIHYGLLLALISLALAYMGWPAFRIVLVPLLLLLFTIPLPGFLYEGLSNKLQLISSEIGVWFIRLFGISVFLEGNVIDLGAYKLQVVEACSGLRYLFPLVTLGFIAAYFFKGTLWKRALIFLSSIPITVLMNSFRVGAIGVMVEYWGQGMAEGFLHDFEGWVVFMTCMAVLIVEMWLLAHVGSDRKPLRVAFGLEFPEPVPKDATVRTRKTSRALAGGTVLLVLVSALSVMVPEQKEYVPPRQDFSAFPLSLGRWSGHTDPLESIYVDALRFDDYIQAEYVDGDGARVSLFASYYSSQLGGNMPHSPRACLPGGGWLVTSLEYRELNGLSLNGAPFVVNRVVIRKGDYKQLVYYWFQQRGRVVASEFLVKWYIFLDSITRHRSDGSLIRLITLIGPGEDIKQGDRRLKDFASAVETVLPQYIPN